MATTAPDAAASPTSGILVCQLVAQFSTTLPQSHDDDGRCTSSARKLSFSSPAAATRRASALAQFGRHRFTQPSDVLSENLRAAISAASASGLAVTRSDCELVRWPAPMPVVCSDSSNPWALRWVQSGQSGCVTLACSLEALWVLGAGQTIFCTPVDHARASCPEAGKVVLSFEQGHGRLALKLQPAEAAELAAAVQRRAALRAALLRLQPEPHTPKAEDVDC